MGQVKGHVQDKDNIPLNGASSQEGGWRVRRKGHLCHSLNKGNLKSHVMI